MTQEPVAAKFMEMAEQARRETRELRAEIERLTFELKAAKNEIEIADGEIERLRTESEAFRGKLAEQCGQTLVARDEIERLQRHIDMLEGTLDENEYSGAEENKAWVDRESEVLILRTEVEQLKRDAIIWQAVCSQDIGIERELRIKIERLKIGIDRIVGLCLSDAGIGKIHARLVALLADDKP